MISEEYPIPKEEILLQYSEWERENDLVTDRLISEAWLKYHKPCPIQVRLLPKEAFKACSSCSLRKRCPVGKRVIRSGGFSDFVDLE